MSKLHNLLISHNFEEGRVAAPRVVDDFEFAVRVDPYIGSRVYLSTDGSMGFGLEY